MVHSLAAWRSDRCGGVPVTGPGRGSTLLTEMGTCIDCQRGRRAKASLSLGDTLMHRQFGPMSFIGDLKARCESRWASSAFGPSLTFVEEPAYCVVVGH